MNMHTISSAEAEQEFDSLLDRAETEVIAITHNDQTLAVIMPYTEYYRLCKLAEAYEHSQQIDQQQ